MSDYIGGKPTSWVRPREKNGAIPINVQDQTTPPLDALFARELSAFTLAADTGISTVITTVVTFTASTGHGIAPNDEIILIDAAADRSLQAVVIGVVGDVITIDRPIDHVFASSTTLGRITTTNMGGAVGTLAAPLIYAIRAGVKPTDVTRVIIRMLDADAMDDGRFGGLPALTNGVVFRVVNGYQKTIFNFKTNGDIRQFCYDVSYIDKAPAGLYGLGARITFAGQDKHGVTIRLSTNDVLQWLIQDDLTGLDIFRVSVQGHEVTD
jgi:hypothetical protein